VTAGNADGEAKQVLVALDEFANALIGGDPHWTISARIWANQPKGGVWPLAMALVNWGALTFFKQPDHCHQAWLRMISDDKKDTASA